MNSLFGKASLGGLGGGAESEAIQKLAIETSTKQVEDHIKRTREAAQSHADINDSVVNSIKICAEQRNILLDSVERMINRKDCPQYLFNAYYDALDLFDKL